MSGEYGPSLDECLIAGAVESGVLPSECSGCRGFGRDTDGTPCDVCGGTGTVVEAMGETNEARLAEGYGRTKMIDLKRITRGKESLPPRVLVYGFEGVGKTRFAVGAPDP